MRAKGLALQKRILRATLILLVLLAMVSDIVFVDVIEDAMKS